MLINGPFHSINEHDYSDVSSSYFLYVPQKQILLLRHLPDTFWLMQLTLRLIPKAGCCLLSASCSMVHPRK